MSRIKLLIAALSFAGLFLWACQTKQPETPTSANTNTSTPAANKTTDPKVVDEVKEMLTKHDKALNDQNIDAVVDTFSNDPKVVMLGTGQGERFVGKDNIKNAYTEIFKDYEKGTLTTNCDWKTGDADPNGKIAWMAATCQAKDSMKGKTREYVLNVSAAAVKEATGWKFIMLHMSNSSGGAPPPPEAKK